jgi:hypothetical protein
MPLEVSPALLEGAGSILKLLGATTVTGFLGLWTAWIAFPPELVIEAVTDKSKKFNSESRIKIKNIGKLRAFDVYCNAENLSFKTGGISLSNCTARRNGSQLIHRLSGGESTETTITPGIHFDKPVQTTEFSYTLELEYQARMLGLRKRLAKKWNVELRTFEDGFSWNIAPIK